MSAQPNDPDSRLIEKAVSILRRGGLVAFPTETVYGLGADASDAAAVAGIFRVKGRPASHPVIVHIAEAGQLTQWARDIPAAARALAEKFWPGPLTLVLRRGPQVSDALTGGQDTIGIRVPGHPVALELLRRFSGGIAAPSANRFGRISPTTAEHVRADLGEDVDLVLDGGPCRVGIESTIVDFSRERPALLRPGQIGASEIAETTGVWPAQADALSPRTPGALDSHYAPRKPLRLIASDRWDEAVRDELRTRAVLSLQTGVDRAKCSIWITAPQDPAGYAHELYSNLRLLDASECDEIWVEEPPAAPAWSAVRDRLVRARSL